MSAAEVLAQHLPLLDGFECEGCDWKAANQSCTGSAEFAAHQLDALKAAGYEIVRVAAECVHCGLPIKWEPDFKRWFHPSSGIEYCYRDPQHTEMATPKAVAVVSS